MILQEGGQAKPDFFWRRLYLYPTYASFLAVSQSPRRDQNKSKGGCLGAYWTPSVA